MIWPVGILLVIHLIKILITFITIANKKIEYLAAEREKHDRILF